MPQPLFSSHRIECGRFLPIPYWLMNCSSRPQPTMRSGVMPSDPQVREETPSGPSSRAPESFGARMRHERERRKISIASIAENTKILGALLEGLEHDDVSRWPTGFYRRAFMRAYANAIGVDAEAALKEFLEQYPEPEDAAPPTAPSATVQHPATANPALRVQTPAVRS